jgi:hypothetical protein
VFHVELRQFPNVTRVFNLNARELHARVVAPWTAGQAFDLQDHRWDPHRAKLTIYQARELAAEELGMGRGWGTVTRDGEEVTEQLLAAARAHEEGPAELTEVKTRLLAAAAEAPLPLAQVVELAGDVTWRASERLRVAEQTVWELLHEERLTLLQDGAVLTRDRWQPVILSWSAWVPGAGLSVQASGAD